MMTDIQRSLTDIQRSIIDLSRSVKDLPKSMKNLPISNSLATLLMVPYVVTAMPVFYNSIVLVLYLLSVSSFEISKLPLIYLSMMFFSLISVEFTKKWAKDKSSIVKLRMEVAQLSLLAISSSLSVFFASNNYSLAIFKSVTGIAIGICNSSIKEDVEKIQNVIGLRVWGLKIFTFVAIAAAFASFLLSEILVMLDVSLVKCDALVAFLSLSGLVLVALRSSDLRSCSNEIDELIEDYTDKDHEQSLEEDKVQGKKLFGLVFLCVVVHLCIINSKSQAIRLNVNV